MTQAIVDAIHAHQRKFDTSAWIQPRGVVEELQTLATMLDCDIEDYPRHFTYPDAPVAEYLAHLDEIRQLVAAADLHPRLEALLAAHLDRLAQRGKSVIAGDEEYSRLTVELDGLPTESLVKRGREILDQPQTQSNDAAASLSAPGAAQRLAQALTNYGLSDWRVEVSESMTARMSVNGPQRRVRVRSSASFTEREVRRLLVHEIGGHVLRWVNSTRQREPLAALPFGATIPTEEGLALWNEVRFDLADRATQRVYAARVLAAHSARTQGILAVGREILPDVGPGKAAEIAMRAKRGLTDPNNPGGATKDWSYLGGLEVVTQLAHCRPDRHRLLQGVKWSMEHLDVVDDLAGDGLLQAPELTVDLERLGVP